MLQSHIEGVITEYYPENIGDYLLKKKRLLEKASKGKKKAQSKIGDKDLKTIYDLLKLEIVRRKDGVVGTE